MLICASYFSVNALFELGTLLKKASHIHILLDCQMDTEARFGYDALEWQQYHDVKGKHKAEAALAIIEEKCCIMTGYINKSGKVQDTLKADLRSGNVQLPADLDNNVKRSVIEILKQTSGKLEIKRNEEKQVIHVNKQVLLSPEFKELWNKIKYKTTYAVDFDSESLIKACQKQISDRLVVSRGKLVYEKATIDVTKGGVEVKGTPETEYGAINTEVTVLPDIVSYLQNETQLTRKSIVAILMGCTNLRYFKLNPQKYIEGCIEIINEQMRLHIVGGIVYTRMGEHEVYSQELFQNEQLTGYLKNNMVASTKSPYKHVVYQSNVESDLTKEFERNNNVKVYAKLPGWFQIDTPLGKYNPDWAVLFDVDGTEKLFLVVESKGTMGFDFLRPAEQGKIECGKRHFQELARNTGSRVSLEYVSNMEEFVTKVLAKVD